jgi:hypothetical protein
VPKRSSKRAEPSRFGAAVVSEATDELKIEPSGKDSAAVSLARHGSLKDGKAGAEAPGEEQRSDNARRPQRPGVEPKKDQK